MADYCKIIDENIVPLCDLTNCNTLLLDKCAEAGILTRDECREIELSRNRQLYALIRGKDAKKFRKMVDIMGSSETKQSNDVLAILKRGLKTRQPKVKDEATESDSTYEERANDVGEFGWAVVQHLNNLMRQNNS